VTVRRAQYGTFIKTASHQVVELFGDVGFDFAVLDAEHAPLDRVSIDVMMVAGRSIQLPLFVRVMSAERTGILSVLDLGAAGLLVPHVDTAAQAREVVAYARFRGGMRGFSGSPRAAGYGRLSRDAIIEIGDATTIVCQIESPEAVQNVDEIAATPGVAGVFLGRADLAMTMEVNQTSPEIDEAIAKTGAAAARNGKIFGMFVSRADDIAHFEKAGANWFIIGSDQAMLRGGACAVMEQVRSAVV
jgi:2-keto-3-deoxy-L-rhamnonate aldolase RhmA